MLLSSHGQILADPYFWIFFIPAAFVMAHFILLMIIIPTWLMDGYFDPKDKKEKKHSKLTAIANDIGIENKTVAPQKKIGFFSWLVYKKKVRDYYLPYVRNIGEIEGDIWESRKKVKPDSIPRYFYGALFSNQPLSDILCTKDSSDPYIMVATQRIPKGKNNTVYNRIIHYRSNALDLPKCAVDPTHEWVDTISPAPDDINFISDKEFSKKFDLTGDDQAKIRALFNKDVRGIMVKNPDWIWKFDNNSILIKYRIKNQALNEMDDIKPSLGELSKLHNKLKTTDITTLPTKEEIDADTPQEIIDKKLYNKRMVTFGCILGCSTVLILLALFMLLGFLIRIDFAFLFQGIFVGLVGIPLFIYGRSEWKRNKKLKKDGKVQ